MIGLGAGDLPTAEPSGETIERALREIKRDARTRRIAMVAPVVLAFAVLGAFVAAPPQHGGLALVLDAEASDENVLPRVFGANGVWRLAEPIGDSQVPAVPPPPWHIDLPDEPSTLFYVLVPPAQGDEQSLSASASSPPTPTLRQSMEDPLILGDLTATEPSTVADDIEWSDFQPEIRIETAASEPDAADDDTDVAPDASGPAEATTPPDNSSPDEDVSGPATPAPEPTGETDAATTASVADTGNPSEANPSTPQPDSSDQGAQPSSAVATIVPKSVLVHRAHVSVTVQIVDDDSSVIDWCNTRVDWGDGSVTGLTDPDGEATCAAPCEQAASPSEVGINTELVFTHEYSVVIDAAPRLFVATGDGCEYTLAELQLNPFTVVPY